MIVFVGDHVNARVPSQVIWVDEEDPSPRHSRRSGGLDMANLKHQPHGGGEWDALVAGKSHHLHVCVFASRHEVKKMTYTSEHFAPACVHTHLVVIHDSVE